MDEVQDAAWVYFGTQRSGPGTGLSRARFDARAGVLTPPVLIAVADDPAYLVSAPARPGHPTYGILYSSNSGSPGGVSAYAIAQGSGELTFLNAHHSKGRGPSQLSLDRTGRFVFTANYDGGYVEALAVADDGSLGPQTACIQHEGRGPHPERQTQPHPHCIRVDPTNRFALVADLGLDRVAVYRFDVGTGALAPHDPAYLRVAPGCGPRHLSWHPNGRWLYVVQEIASAVTVLSWDAAEGTLRELQTVPALPRGFAGDNTSAEILVHPGGGFVYVSNRGHDSVAAFAVDPASGKLEPRQHIGSGGRTPRYLAFDLTGEWLLATNHDSDTVAVFWIDPETGRLRQHGSPVAAHRPFGLAFAPV